MPLLDELTTDGAVWPPEAHANRLAEQRDYHRLYRNESAELRQYWSAELDGYLGDEELVPYPSVKLVSRIVAAFLFGEDPELRATTAVEPDAEEPDAESEGDPGQEVLDAWATETNVYATLLEGAVVCAYSGEVYLRPAWDAEALGPWPLLTVLPGRRVIPRFRHGKLVEGVVFTERAVGTSGTRRLRLFEHHEPGGITTRVYYGTGERVGSAIDLADERVVRAFGELEEETDTGIDEVLLTHVPFQRDDGPHGRSIVDGAVGLVFALHRLYSQEQHDAELARFRIAAPSSYLKRTSKGDPRFDRRTDVLELDDSAAGVVGQERPITPIQFRDDVVQRERIQGRLRDLMVACGIAPQTLGEDAGRGAESGTARRLAQALTVQTVSAAGRYWQAALPRAIRQTLAVGRIHLGLDVPDDLDVSVTLSDGFVDDPREVADRIAVLDGAEAISAETKVRELHPTWTEEQVAEEVERIRAGAPVPPRPSIGEGVTPLRSVE